MSFALPPECRSSLGYSRVESNICVQIQIRILVLSDIQAVILTALDRLFNVLRLHTDRSAERPWFQRLILAGVGSDVRVETQERASRHLPTSLTRPFRGAGRKLLHVAGRTMSSKAAIDHNPTESRPPPQPCNLSPLYEPLKPAVFVGGTSDIGQGIVEAFALNGRQCQYRDRWS